MLTKIARAWSDVLFPGICAACNRLFSKMRTKDPTPAGIAGLPADADQRSNDFHRYLGAFVCPDCIANLRSCRSPLCTCCGAVFRSRAGGDHLCAECLERPKRFATARSAGVFDGAMKALVHAIKYRSKTRLTVPLGRCMRDRAIEWWGRNSFDWVIPVPLHPRKLRTRGFNQALLLVNGWCSDPAAAGGGGPAREVVSDLLVRHRATAPQAGLGKTERRKNIRGAFRLTQPKRIQHRRVLLVDDVYTTGATAEECAGVLRRAGAARVDVLTLARAL